MSLICQTIYATADNKKLPIVKQCLISLAQTVNLKKHRWIIIDNSCYKETAGFLDIFQQGIDGNITVIHLKDNVGTARGINIGLKTRDPGEVVIKTDDDLTWSINGWVEQLEYWIKKRPEIGILGLKRDDVYGNFTVEGKLLWSHDIFGTCTAYNPLMLDKVGFLTQPSTTYGYDDSIFSVRSEAAGFRNAFLPHIKITNLDKGGTEYTEWKKREAGVYLKEASIMMDLIKNGTLSYYYDEC